MLSWNLDPSLFNVKCQGKKGICEFTEKRHQFLQGKDQGRFWTHLAEPFPQQLCKMLGRVFSNALACKVVEKLSKAIK